MEQNKLLNQIKNIKNMKNWLLFLLLLTASFIGAQDSLLIAYASSPPQFGSLYLNSNVVTHDDLLRYKAGKGLKVEQIGNTLKITQDPPFTLSKDQILKLAETSQAAKDLLKTIYPQLLKEVVDLSTARSSGVATIGINGGMGRLVLVQAQNNGANLYGGKSLLVGAAFTAEVIQDGKDQLIIFKRKD